MIKFKRIFTCIAATATFYASAQAIDGSFLDWPFQSKNARKVSIAKIPELGLFAKNQEIIVLPIILQDMGFFDEYDRPLDEGEDGEGGDEAIPAAELYEVWDNLLVNPYRMSTDSVLKEDQQIDISGFTYPLVKHYRVTSDFGPRRKRYHYGIDLKLERGDTVVSAFDGMVRIAKKMKGYGNFILVRHHNGMESFYGHLDDILVQPGQTVKSGELIGLGGNTGRSTGPHLHFELRYLGLPINPRDMVNFESLASISDTVMLTRSSFNYPQKKGKGAAKKTVIASKTTATAKGKTVAKAAATTGGRVYTVKPGDSLGLIAQRVGVSVSKICAANGIGAKTTIKPGQKLKY